ncbi:MerR family transcriptional regulator [Massilia sp. TSP1-1-2]|uniref:MerR family transcriptional regulator n=1 Tax=unclassified Massilia TaxID=2609279 RepID=UPI003CE9DA29
MNTCRISIGALSKQTNCTVPTIRYYEQIGLLPKPERAENGHRYYRAADLSRLAFIKRCRDFGFPIEQVRDLAHLFDDGARPCVEVRDLAQVHLDQVRAKIADMRDLEASLQAFIGGCDSSCIGGPTTDCVIITDISAGPSPSSAKAASCCSSAPVVPAKPLFARELKRA